MQLVVTVHRIEATHRRYLANQEIAPFEVIQFFDQDRLKAGELADACPVGRHLTDELRGIQVQVIALTRRLIGITAPEHVDERRISEAITNALIRAGWAPELRTHG